VAGSRLGNEVFFVFSKVFEDKVDTNFCKFLGSLNEGVQGWCSGESARLPPMCPGFDSRTRRHMWVEFVGSLLCSERFSPGTPVSPLLKNQHLI